MANNKKEVKKNILIQMEELGINPFGKYLSLSVAMNKANEYYKYKMAKMKPEDKDYFLLDTLRRTSQCCCCSKHTVLESNNSRACNEVLERRNLRENLVLSKTIGNVCNKLFCLRDNEINRNEKVDELDLIIEDLKKLGHGLIMVTIVAPFRIEGGISQRDKVDKFHKVLNSLFRTNIKKTKARFKILNYISEVEELAWSIVNFQQFIHVHIMIEFKNEGDKEYFQERFDEFKEYVFKAISKAFKIEDEDNYKKDCVYVTKVIDKETGETLLTPKDGDYFRKSYKDGENRFKDWNEKRIKYFSVSENFDREREIFNSDRLTDGDRKLISDFYHKKIVEQKLFCFKEGEMVSLGGRITKEDRKLKESNPALYKKIINLKMYGVRRFYETAGCYYRPKEEGMSRTPNVYQLFRIGNNGKKYSGGAEEIKKRIKETKRQAIERREKEVAESCQDAVAEEVAKENLEVKNIAESNRKEENREEIYKEQIRLLESKGIKRDRVNKEIIDRMVKIYAISVNVSNYLYLDLAFKTNWDITIQSIRDCFYDEKTMKLHNKEGILKSLYELTELYSIDRTGIFISRYMFKDDEYAKYFPKLDIDENLERELKAKIGITLKEYSKMWYYYTPEELHEVVDKLIDNPVPEDRESVMKILERMKK